MFRILPGTSIAFIYAALTTKTNRESFMSNQLITSKERFMFSQTCTNLHILYTTVHRYTLYIQYIVLLMYCRLNMKGLLIFCVVQVKWHHLA
jgi:hypothetical protein